MVLASDMRLRQGALSNLVNLSGEVNYAMCTLDLSICDPLLFWLYR